MTFGYVVPPMIWGTPRDQAEQAASLKRKGLQVTPVIRLGCTLQVAREIHKALAQQVGEVGNVG